MESRGIPLPGDAVCQPPMKSPATSVRLQMALAARGQSEEPSEALFEAAFRKHYGRVQAIAARIAAGDAEAEELTQEAFLRLHGAPVLHRPEDEVGAWLVRVVTNLALNALRGRRREQARLERLASLEAWEVAGRSGDADPAHIALCAEERQQVRAVLQQLPPRARACLVLRHSGLSYAEIAAALGTTPGSVGTMLARAEHAFAERWKRCTNGV
ncbi:MAG: sigma-70 family RNA polymerase sigma factor [Bacteroidetes bacterium]|nr:sigma-70 family RNA polymerase sigma factor [Bacteroidota bacterium]MCL5025374.1 sigma-70 family RNA polymerase sigma factor [Chloroflexota bacterium]